ncbi:hypothetical protein B0H10DRAFT_2201213 [Mycena sp. CBHHK59/15]|nr:hypothetical protein B0H10DRAFT_2201213 [Mycena sp. CBHHK59/15]
MNLGNTISLPLELEREIFETTALRDFKMIPTLMCLSRRVLFWIEPFLYRTIFFDTTPSSIAPIMEKVRAKPDDFFQNAIRHLIISNVSWTFMCGPEKAPCTDAELEPLLRVCTGTDTLHVVGVLMPTLLPLVAKHLAPTRLTLDVRLLLPPHAPQDLTRSLFRNVTHLHLYDDSPIVREWPFWVQLHRLPRLTHLVVSPAMPAAFVPGVLAGCPHLMVLVIGFTKVDIPDISDALAVHDPRVVCMALSDSFAEYGWERAEEFVAKKKKARLKFWKQTLSADSCFTVSKTTGGPKDGASAIFRRVNTWNQLLAKFMPIKQLDESNLHWFERSPGARFECTTVRDKPILPCESPLGDWDLRSDVDVDPAVRIVVTPSQSSYFAGEPFSVTITFTNTRSPEPGPSRTTSHSHAAHRRGAHSISSAPISRPPTSPGTPRTPRTAVPPLPPRVSRDDKPGRKGLIGRTVPSPAAAPASTGSLPALVEQRRKKMLAKSLSVSIAPPDLDMMAARSVQTPRSASFLPDSDSPVSPQLPSSISRRSDTLPLASTHPHARKQSIFDGQQEIISSPISASTSTTLPSPFTPSASSSTFSLALDPIAESAVYPYPPTPALSSSAALGHPPTIAAPAATPTRAYPPRRVQPTSLQAQGQAQIGLGHPSPAPTRTAHSAPFAPPHTELLLYAYASLAGRAVLAPLAGTGTPALGVLRATLLRPARGGGSLSLQAASGGAPPRHRRAGSFSAGLRALGAGIGIWGRTNGAGEAAGGGDADESDSEAPVPTLEVQPEMLAVDLSLGPGESRSYTYTLLLPANLPPTFKGRTLRFSYELVIGVCRAAGGSSVSRVMKVPIRVYNNVVGALVFLLMLLIYSHLLHLSWPPRAPLRPHVARRPPDSHTPTTPTGAAPPIAPSHDDLKPTVEECRGPLLPAAPPKTLTVAGGSVVELQRYAAQLLAASMSPSSGGFPRGLAENGLVGEGGGGGLSGCREAVEVLTRNLKKVSYDITKDGVMVAVLTFPKSAFRLGETVSGVVEVNWRGGRGRVLQLTALLEAHESLPSALATPPGSPATERYLRRVHAEHHARFVLGTLRLGFALDIPSDGSPAFGVVGSSTGGHAGGLEWKVRLCLLVAVAREESDTGTEGVRAKGLMRDVDEADGGGRGAWGSAWRAPPRLGVLERTPTPPPPPPAPVSPPPQEKDEKSVGWGAFFAASFLGGREGGYHDGDDLDDEDEGGGGAAGAEGRVWVRRREERSGGRRRRGSALWGPRGRVGGGESGDGGDIARGLTGWNRAGGDAPSMDLPYCVPSERVTDAARKYIKGPRMNPSMGEAEDLHRTAKKEVDTHACMALATTKTTTITASNFGTIPATELTLPIRGADGVGVGWTTIDPGVSASTAVSTSAEDAQCRTSAGGVQGTLVPCFVGLSRRPGCILPEFRILQGAVLPGSSFFPDFDFLEDIHTRSKWSGRCLRDKY